MPDLKAIFEKHEDKFLRFEQVQNKRHPRPDLCAFLMLHDLVPGERPRDMVDCAEHDEIWLDVDVEALAIVATEEQIVDLMRCGVRYDADVDRLAMYV